MRKKIKNLKITQTRRKTIEVHSLELRFRCRQCERDVEVVTRAQAEALLETDAETFDRLIADGQLHTISTKSGKWLICKDSLLG